MTLNRWTVLWLAVVALLLIILIFELVGLFRIEDLIANPVLFLVAFVIVAVLSAVGAMFIGVFITHRIFSSEGFTPFEREMLQMRKEVQAIREKLEDVVKALHPPREED